MKHHTYNGVCVMVVAKTGDLTNVPIAMALIPCESTNDFYEFKGSRWKTLLFYPTVANI
jgi:hypothetical protein